MNSGVLGWRSMNRFSTRVATGKVTEASDAERSFVLWHDNGGFEYFRLARGVKSPACYERVRLTVDGGYVRAIESTARHAPRSL
jgi:hypothetical protein